MNGTVQPDLLLFIKSNSTQWIPLLFELFLWHIYDNNFFRARFASQSIKYSSVNKQISLTTEIYVQ